jgi:hypothetical protein
MTETGHKQTFAGTHFAVMLRQIAQDRQFAPELAEAIFRQRKTNSSTP